MTTPTLSLGERYPGVRMATVAFWAAVQPCSRAAKAMRELVAWEAWGRGGASRRYQSSDAEEFGLPELAHSVERFDLDDDLGRTSAVVA